MVYISGSQLQMDMRFAEKQYREDMLQRQLVDVAVAQSMRLFNHIDSAVDRHDLQVAAVTAAMAALHLSIENDTTLKALTVERDRYKELAEKGMASMVPTTPFLAQT